MEHWYALYTKPHKEHQVEALLQGRGIEAYLPTVQRKVRRRDRPDRVVFFPSYLFARLDLERIPRSSIAWMPGVRRLVRAGQEPVIVADELVALIRRRLEDIDEVGYRGLNQGDRVQIISGPMRDLEAVFYESARAADRVRILLDVMGRMASVEIDISRIRKI